MINKNDEYYYIEKENSSKKSRLKTRLPSFFKFTLGTIHFWKT